MSEAQFRIGACYRTNGGDVVRLLPGGTVPEFMRSAYAGTEAAVAQHVRGRMTCGWRRLDNGMLGSAQHDPVNHYHLIPGEVDERGFLLNDPWKAALDKLEAGYAAQAKRQTKTPTLDKLANTAEPKRPALTWNAKTAFDAFPGFKVSSDSDDLPIFTGSFPTSDTASHQVTPKFGSSDLA